MRARRGSPTEPSRVTGASGAGVCARGTQSAHVPACSDKEFSHETSLLRALNSPRRPYLRRQERTTKRPTASPQAQRVPPRNARSSRGRPQQLRGGSDQPRSASRLANRSRSATWMARAFSRILRYLFAASRSAGSSAATASRCRSRRCCARCTRSSASSRSCFSVRRRAILYFSSQDQREARFSARAIDLALGW
jgi:hypothetical protein